MSARDTLDLRHLPSYYTGTTLAQVTLDEVQNHYLGNYHQPERLRLRPDQWELLTQTLKPTGHPDGDPKTLWGIPVVVVGDEYPYLIGGDLHGERVPPNPSPHHPLRYPAGGGGGEYRTEQYVRSKAQAGGEPLAFWHHEKMKDPYTALIKDMRERVLEAA